jgi:hypothetical protein
MKQTIESPVAQPDIKRSPRSPRGPRCPRLIGSPEPLADVEPPVTTLGEVCLLLK